MLASYHLSSPKTRVLPQAVRKYSTRMRGLYDSLWDLLRSAFVGLLYMSNGSPWSRSPGCRIHASRCSHV